MKINQMYTTEEPFFQNILDEGVTPRQNILEEHEDLFLITYGNMLLHKRLRREQILSPYTIPFRPAMEIKYTTMERNVQKARDNKHINKEDIASSLQVPVENITLKEEKRQEEE